MYQHRDGIYLRKIEGHDLYSLLKLKQESWWGTHKTSILNNDDQSKWFESIPSDQLYMMAEKEIIASTSGKPVLSAIFKRTSGVVKTNKENGRIFRTTIGVAAYTDIDYISRSLKLSGSVYQEFRKAEIVTPAFSAGVDFAFEMLNMRRIETEVLEINLPSQKLQIDHLGFKIEGRKRQAIYKCGQYYDSIVLGLLREEWERQPRVLAYNGTCNDNFDRDLMGRMAERSAEKMMGTEPVYGAL